MLEKLSLKKKILVLFLAAAVVQVGCALGTLLCGLRQTIAEQSAVEMLKAQRDLAKINELVYATVMESRGIYMQSDWKSTEQFAKKLLSYTDQLSALAPQMSSANHQAATEPLKRARANVASFVDFRRELVRLAKDESNTKAREFGDNNENRRNRSELNDNLNALAEMFGAAATERVQVAEMWRNRMWWAGMLVLILPFAGVIVAIAVTQHALAKPLDAVKSCVSRMARGDLQIEIYGRNRSDEVGEIAKAVNQLKEKLLEGEFRKRTGDAERAKNSASEVAARDAAIASERELIANSIGVGLASIAAKNMTYRMREALPEAYCKLQRDFNHAIEQLEQALSSVHASAGTIRTGTQEIAVSADDLSRRTEQQAASLEETVAALDEITKTVGATAASAAVGRDTAAATKEVADHGGAVVQQAVTAMDKIQRSSQEIGQIITVVDEIAFQTNLLALNAGVEAARAGEAGRGFAVVASEVRSLAQRSAGAAAQIKVLISTSTNEVSDGVRLVGETGKALERIAVQVAQVNGVVSKIATSAQEQALSLRQVNAAINEMDQMTQQNAAMAEQATAASRSLAQEGEQLGDMIGKFRLCQASSTSLRDELRQVVPHAFRSELPSRPRSTDAIASGRREARPVLKSVASRVATQHSNDGWEEF